MSGALYLISSRMISFRVAYTKGREKFHVIQNDKVPVLVITKLARSHFTARFNYVAICCHHGLYKLMF